jgi:hypothetical protein
MMHREADERLPKAPRMHTDWAFVISCLVVEVVTERKGTLTLIEVEDEMWSRKATRTNWGVDTGAHINYFLFQKMLYFFNTTLPIHYYT